MNASMNIRFEGALDALSARDVRPRLAQMVSAGADTVTVDLGAVTMLDSCGVGVIMSLLRRVEAGGGRMRVIGVHDQPRVVMKVLELETLLGC
jgi:anti-sigma B factor antagonist